MRSKKIHFPKQKFQICINFQIISFYIIKLHIFHYNVQKGHRIPILLLKIFSASLPPLKIQIPLTSFGII